METKTLLIALFLLGIIAVVPANGCDCTERKYLIVDQNVTFNEAVQLCLQYGMEIASPLSAEENTTLANALAAEASIASKSATLRLGVWIGARRVPRNSTTFYWVNTGKPLLFSYFRPGQPDNYENKENCLHLRNSSNPVVNGWNDTPCNAEIAFACQTRCCINGCRV